MLFVKSLVVIGFFCAITTLTACGGGSASDTAQGHAAVSTDSVKAAALPKIQVSKGPPPKSLVLRDLKVGTGPAVKKTDAVVVAYEGVAYKTGKLFDIRKRSEPFFFQTSVGRVMPGFDLAVIGMKVGGLREAIIPPGLTLNELGKPETLVYVIEMLSDESAARYHHRLNHGESLSLAQFG